MKDPASTPDILLFLSDQHHGRSTGYAGRDRPDTPNLDRIAANGTICETAYTACPLCVPARSALLTGQFTSRNGMFDNSAVLPSDQATFLNSLVDAGYETVLCGRMHFKGADQRHGFTKRIMGDITRPYADGVVREGVFTKVFGMGGCLDLIGRSASSSGPTDLTSPTSRLPICSNAIAVGCRPRLPGTRRRPTRIRSSTRSVSERERTR